MAGDNAARRVRLGRWLREQRCMRDLTVLEVSQRLSIDLSHVYSCERGRHVPSFDVFDRWLLTLDVDFLDVIGAVP